MNPDEIRERWSQEGDCCSPHPWHALEASIEDGGGGPFLVFSTERWAVDDEKELEEVFGKLRDLLRLGRSRWEDAEREEKERKAERTSEERRLAAAVIAGQSDAAVALADEVRMVREGTFPEPNPDFPRREEIENALRLLTTWVPRDTARAVGLADLVERIGRWRTKCGVPGKYVG